MSSQTAMSNSEDQKLLTLARASLQRTSVAQSAALRDGTGRTHVGNIISLESLHLDATQVALAMAISSGANVIEAVVVVGDRPGAEAISNIREVSSDSLIWHVSADGLVRAL
jgi:hypothetical protein